MNAASALLGGLWLKHRHHRRGTSGEEKGEATDGGSSDITADHVRGIGICRFAYLRLGGRVLIITVGSSTKGSSRSRVASTDTAPLGQVLLALCLANLDLLFLTTATKLIGLEGALGLELGATMLGDIAVSHGCDVMSGRRRPDGWVMVVMLEAANEGRCNRESPSDEVVTSRSKGGIRDQRSRRTG